MKKTPRPKSTPSKTYEFKTHCGDIYITITSVSDNGDPFEIFAAYGKAGGCGAAIIDGITKLASYALRSGMDAKYIQKAFGGICCHHGKETCLNAISEAMEMYRSDVAMFEMLKEGEDGTVIP